jgi:hypothetical protein
MGVPVSPAGVAAFLAAALEQTEAAVEENGLGSPHEKSCGYEQFEFDDPCACYIPEQTLALVAAHRKLAALHKPEDYLAGSYGSWLVCNVCADWNEADDDCPRPLRWPCDTIKILAGAYGWTEQ